MLRRSFPVVALLAFLLSGCSEVSRHRPGAPMEAGPVRLADVGPVRVAEAGAVRVPVGAESPRPGKVVVTSVSSLLDVWDQAAVAGPAFAIRARNPFGQPLSLPVTGVRSRDGEVWLRVLLGVPPNGASGWVRRADVRVRPIQERIVVDLSKRILSHHRGGKVVRTYRVGIGAPGTPTTVGRFFVWAKFPADPAGPYGAYLLGLSGFSEVLTDWPGGGRMAIHGTGDPADRGRKVSHGCVRVFNPQMEELREVPMGTPVLIRR